MYYIKSFITEYSKVENNIEAGIVTTQLVAMRLIVLMFILFHPSTTATPLIAPIKQ